MELNIWLLSLLFIFLLISTFLLLKSQKNDNKLPPGPPKWPIIGNLHQLAWKKSLPDHHLLAELAKVYGPIMHLRLGEVSTVVISSADMAREAMRTHDAVLCSRPKILLGEHLYCGHHDIALAPYGDYWRQVRKIATLELFTMKRVQSFEPIRVEVVGHLLKSIALENCSMVINLSNKLFEASFDITARLAFSIKDGKQTEEFKAYMMEIAKLYSGFSVCDLYPSLKFLPLITGMRRKLEDLVKTADHIFQPILHDHISRKNNDENEDLMDVLLKYHNNDDPSCNGSGFSLTMEHIRSIVLELLGAGSDTSASTVEWAMSELLKNPSIMKKAQDEIRQAFQLQVKETIDEKSLHELKYMKQVIKETLRLHPPSPLLVPREAIKRCEINGYDIPSGTRVLVNAWAIGRDPEYWTEPERFHPERYDGKLVDFKGNHFELIPFGAGRRMCPAMELGLANVELPLAMLLYHFDWKLPNEINPGDLNMDETFGISANRKNHLLVIPTLHTCSPFNRT